MQRLGLVVAVVVLGAAPAASAAVSRSRADRIALSVLRPSRRTADLVVFGLRTPVKAGRDVFAAGPRPGLRHPLAARADTVRLRAEVFNLTAPAWLFWEDQSYGAATGQHPGVLVLIDAASGRVKLRRRIAWEPMIDGRPPVFLRSATAYTGRAFHVFSDVRTLRAGASPRARATAASVIPDEYLEKDCLVTIGDHTLNPELFLGDLADIQEWAVQKGVNLRVFAAPAGADERDLRRLISRAVTGRRPCRNIFLFVAGHGLAEPGLRDPTNPSVLASSYSQPAVIISTHVFRGGQVQWDLLTGSDLEKIMRTHPTTTFEVAIASCFSGRFTHYLAKARLPNLLLVTAQAGSRQLAWSYLASGHPYALPGAPSRRREVANPTRPRQTQFPESDWEHALVDGLDRWRTHKDVFYGRDSLWIGFVNGLRLAAEDAPKRDFSASVLHWTDPQTFVGDLVKVYRYHLTMSVTDGRESFARGADYSDGGGRLTGSATSDWKAAWSIAIVVDRGRRLTWLGDTAHGPKVPTAVPDPYGVHPTDTFTATASGSWQGLVERPSPQAPEAYTCSYSKITPSFLDVRDVGLQGGGADYFAGNGLLVSYGQTGTYQYTGQLGLHLDYPIGVRQGVADCTTSDAFSSINAQGIFIGADDCTINPYTGLDVLVPVWRDLGQTDIKLDVPFKQHMDNVHGCPLQGDRATAQGTYHLSMVRNP